MSSTRTHEARLVRLLPSGLSYVPGPRPWLTSVLTEVSQTEVVLGRGRRLLDTLPYPDNLDNHFVVDPTKFDFYAMDWYRMLSEDKMAENLADEVIRGSSDVSIQASVLDVALGDR